MQQFGGLTLSIDFPRGVIRSLQLSGKEILIPALDTILISLS